MRDSPQHKPAFQLFPTPRGATKTKPLCAAATPSDAFWNTQAACGQAACRQPHSTPLGECYQAVEAGREENNMWPQQYVGLDRRNTAAPFDIMIRNGWRRQNLLGSHHFNEDATQLTQSGKLRVQWILTQPPPTHRQVFIERSITEGVTDARIAATEAFAGKVLAGEPASIVDTHLLSDGRPAVGIDYVNTQYRENMRTPVLPEASAGGGGVATE